MISIRLLFDLRSQLPLMEALECRDVYVGVSEVLIGAERRPRTKGTVTCGHLDNRYQTNGFAQCEHAYTKERGSCQGEAAKKGKCLYECNMCWNDMRIPYRRMGKQMGMRDKPP